MIMEAYMTSGKRNELLQKSTIDFSRISSLIFSVYIWILILQCVAVDSKPKVGPIFPGAHKLRKLLVVIFKRSYSLFHIFKCPRLVLKYLLNISSYTILLKRKKNSRGSVTASLYLWNRYTSFTKHSKNWTISVSLTSTATQYWI